MKKFWKGVLRVLVEVVLSLIKKKVEDKLEDMNNPTHPAKAGFGDVTSFRKLDDMSKKPMNHSPDTFGRGQVQGKGSVTRLLIIVIVGIMAIGLTAWATKPAEIPSLDGMIIIRPLPVEDNPYQKEYDEMLKPAVMITTITGRGTGVIIPGSLVHQSISSTETYILTAAHVVGNFAEVTVTFYTPLTPLNRGESLSAFVVMTDTNKDLALLQIRNPKSEIRNWVTARLAPRDYTYYLFAPVWTVGCSLGLSPRPSFGHITSVPLGDSAVEVSSPILPGNSGGPVYTADTHELIGIAVWVRLYGDQLVTTMAGVVPINVIYEFLYSYRKDAKASSNS